jgi:hypothetical protein
MRLPQGGGEMATGQSALYCASYCNHQGNFLRGHPACADIISECRAVCSNYWREVKSLCLNTFNQFLLCSDDWACDSKNMSAVRDGNSCLEKEADLRRCATDLDWRPLTGR